MDPFANLGKSSKQHLENGLGQMRKNPRIQQRLEPETGHYLSHLESAVSRHFETETRKQNDSQRNRRRTVQNNLARNPRSDPVSTDKYEMHTTKNLGKRSKSRLDSSQLAIW